MDAEVEGLALNRQRKAVLAALFAFDLLALPMAGLVVAGPAGAAVAFWLQARSRRLYRRNYTVYSAPGKPDVLEVHSDYFWQR